MGMSKTTLARVIGVSKFALSDQARAILNKYGATMLLPGVSGVLRFGYQPGNYCESTGQTLAVADQQVGLVVDAARVPGPELVTSSLFVSNSWTKSAGFSVGDGAFSATSVASFSNNYYNGAIDISANKTYRITGNASLSAGSFKLIIMGGTSPVINTSGDFSFVVTAGAAGSKFFVQPQSTLTGTISNISVREIPGIHASQSTSGFQPVLRRGLVNQLQQSNALATLPWGVNDGAIVTNNATTTPAGLPASLVDLTANGAARVANANTLLGGQNNGTTTLAALIRAETSPGTVALQGRRGNGTLVSSLVNVTTEWQLFTLEIPAEVGSTASAVWVGNRLVGGTCHRFFVGGAALFQGTVTAQEIIAAGGIPATTTAPASSAHGIQSWQFDGADDRLSLSAVPFQMADDHFVVCGSVVGSTGSVSSVFAQGHSSGSAIIAVDYTSGAPRVFWKDDSSTQATITHGTSLLNSPCVVSGRKVADSKIMRVNGVQSTASVNTVLGASSFSSAVVGSRYAAGVTNLKMNGHIHGIIFGKGAITDSELLTLERFMATLQGRTL